MLIFVKSSNATDRAAAPSPAQSADLCVRLICVCYGPLCSLYIQQFQRLVESAIEKQVKKWLKLANCWPAQWSALDDALNTPTLITHVPIANYKDHCISQQKTTTITTNSPNKPAEVQVHLAATWWGLQIWTRIVMPHSNTLAHTLTLLDSFSCSLKWILVAAFLAANSTEFNFTLAYI